MAAMAEAEGRSARRVGSRRGGRMSGGRLVDGMSSAVVESSRRDVDVNEGLERKDVMLPRESSGAESCGFMRSWNLKE